MHIRNGIRTTLRNRLRTILFTLLILVLTLVLTLGIELWVYCIQLTEQIDASYTSIVLAEYMGDDYPDADAVDERARAAMAALDDGAISAIEGVTLWERSDSALLLPEGYTRTSGNRPYRTYGVVVASSLSALDSTIGWGTSPAATTVLPEDCLVINVETMEAVFYALGQEPLTLPVYYRTDQEDRFEHIVPDKPGVYHFETVPLDQMPALYMLYEQTDDGYTCSVNGELPAGYTTWPLYRYNSYMDTYDFYGEHNDGYTGRISKAIYTNEGKDGILAVFESGLTDFVPEKGKTYLLHGRFVESGTSNRTFAVTEFYEGCETKPWLELSGEDDPALTDSLFTQAAERYRTANNTAVVTASDDISALEPFHQETLYLADGRFPRAGEAGVCLISGSMAEQMDIGVGDTLNVSVLTSGSEDRYELTSTGDGRAWEIVGVTNVHADYEGALWVSKAEGDFTGPMFGYYLGRAVLENSQAAWAVEALEALMPDQVRLTFYDQGYSAAVQPIQAMRSAAMGVTAAAICGALAVLFLFAYLFVGRQRETVQVLVSLGTPRSKIRLWLLSGAVLITAVSSVLGAFLGQVSLGGVIRLAMLVAELLYGDLRYSSAAVGLMKETPAAESVPALYAVAAGVMIFVVSLLLCLIFLRHARKENAPKKGKTSVRVPKGKTSLFGHGPARFALLSARRGGWRSIVVPAAALVLTVLLGLLTANAAGWQRQLNDLYENTALEGQAVTLNGRSASKLTIPVSTARELWRSGYLSDISVSMGWKYWLENEMPAFSGTGFGDESRNVWILQQPELVALSGLNAAPEFYYTGTPEVEWLDGWDESFLSGNDYYSIPRSLVMGYGLSTVDGEEDLTYPVLASRAFLEAHELDLGDEWEIMARIAFQNSTIDLQIPVKAVGTFQQVGLKQNLYVPLSIWCELDWITGEEAPLAEGEMFSLSNAITTPEKLDKYLYSTTTFRTCRFTLASAHDLEGFRDFLAEKNYSQVGKANRNRTTILLLDQTFQEAAGSLRRYITFGYILFPVLFLAVALLGYLISWLMVNGRRMEFAILRGVGASSKQVFYTFFLEQGALCLIGSLTGALALTVFYQSVALWLVTAGFFACYLAGCALAIRAVGQTKLITLLSERE